VWRGERIPPATFSPRVAGLEGTVDASHLAACALSKSRARSDIADAGNLHMKGLLERVNVAGARVDKAGRKPAP